MDGDGLVAGDDALGNGGDNPEELHGGLDEVERDRRFARSLPLRRRLEREYTSVASRALYPFAELASLFDALEPDTWDKLEQTTARDGIRVVRVGTKGEVAKCLVGEDGSERCSVLAVDPLVEHKSRVWILHAVGKVTKHVRSAQIGYFTDRLYVFSALDARRECSRPERHQGAV